MADPTKVPNEELERMRDLSAATYLSSYVRLMVRHLGLDESDTEGINHMAVLMIEPMSIATEAAWRALMNDNSDEIEKVLARFKSSLDNM